MAISFVRVFIIPVFLYILFCGDVKAQAKTVEDLFNNTSCLKGPIVCPNPRIEFYLYTRETQTDPFLIDVLDAKSLDKSKFNRQHPTKIIIHGFGGGRNLAPSTDLRDAYFRRGNYNIIIVDYGSLVKEPCLSQVRWGPSFCSQCIAQLVRYLKNHPRGTPVESIHVLGYSVGAHIAGLMANYLPGDKLGRITASDPHQRQFGSKFFPHVTFAPNQIVLEANVAWEKILNQLGDGLDPTIIFYMGGGNKSLDLDDSDAHFVDVIHTGAGILGQWGPNGHADFYVNGGSSQPGCLGSSILQTLSCDHTKVTPYYIESIITEVGFWAAPCSNLFSYLIGWCSPAENEYVLMGEDTPFTARGIFYLSTNGHKPYARGLPGKSRRTKPRKRLSRQY